MIPCEDMWRTRPDAPLQCLGHDAVTASHYGVAWRAVTRRCAQVEEDPELRDAESRAAAVQAL